MKKTSDLYYIYVITHIPSGKSYVGEAKNPAKRFRQHCERARDSYISKAIAKHGASSFTFEVVGSYPSEKEAFAAERDLISSMKTNDSRYGYNLTAGGEGISGHKHSPETREKMRSSHTGKKHSLSHRESIGAGRKGVIHPPETREKISASLRGRPMLPTTKAALLEANLGKPLSDEHKAKIGDAHRGKVLSDEHKAKVKASHWAHSENRDEIIRKTSEKTRGRTPSPEARANMSAGQKGRKHTEETKRKMSESRKRVISEQKLALSKGKV
jgi:group I intron endonuclease